MKAWGVPCGAQCRVVVVPVAGGLLNAHARGLNQNVTLADPLRNVIVYRRGGGWCLEWRNVVHRTFGAYF